MRIEDPKAPTSAGETETTTEPEDFSALLAGLDCGNLAAKMPTPVAFQIDSARAGRRLSATIAMKL